MDLLRLGEAAPQIAIALAIVAAALLVARFIGGQSGFTKPKRTKDPDSSKRPTVVAVDQVALLKQVNELVSRIDHGEHFGPCPPPQIAECSKRFDTIEVTQESHQRGQRKIFGAIHKLDQGQREILEHLTNGGPSTGRPPVSYDIDDEDTGDQL